MSPERPRENPGLRRDQAFLDKTIDVQRQILALVSPDETVREEWALRYGGEFRRLADADPDFQALILENRIEELRAAVENGATNNAAGT